MMQIKNKLKQTNEDINKQNEQHKPHSCTRLYFGKR